MKEYLLLFRNISGDNDYVSTAQDMAEDMPAWQGWIGNIAGQGKLVATQPITYGGAIVNIDGKANRPYKDGHDILVSGYMICKAESIEEVALWSKTCPILKYPHGSVEIRPVIPFPTN